MSRDARPETFDREPKVVGGKAAVVPPPSRQWIAETPAPRWRQERVGHCVTTSFQTERSTPAIRTIRRWTGIALPVPAKDPMQTSMHLASSDVASQRGEIRRFDDELIRRLAKDEDATAGAVYPLCQMVKANRMESINIARAANQLIEEYGEAALMEASMRAALAYRRENKGGGELWDAVCSEIRQMQPN